MNLNTEQGNSCNETETRASDNEPPVYVSYADFLTLTRNMEACKARSRHRKIGSDGESYRDSSEDNSYTDDGDEPVNKRQRWSSNSRSTSSNGSSSSENIITSDVDEVPNYKVRCCGQQFTSTHALFAHLRMLHRIGVQPDMTRKCKLCRAWVNEDLLMLHVELCHTIKKTKTFEIRTGFVGDKNEDGTKSRYVALNPRGRR